MICGLHAVDYRVVDTLAITGAFVGPSARHCYELWPCQYGLAGGLERRIEK